MNDVIRIAEIDTIAKEAAAIGLTLRRLCAMAGVVHVTVWRWTQEPRQARIGNYEAACAALRAALEDEKARLRGALGVGI